MRRVCFILLSGIGDCVHGLPVVNALKRDAPDRHITWVVQSQPVPLVRPHPAVDQVITFDRTRGIAEISRLWRQLRPCSFDVALNLNTYFKSAIPAFIARAPRKLAFGRDRARDLVWLFANHRLPPSDALHTQDRFLDFLDFLGIERGPLEWRIELSEDEVRAQRRFFEPFEGRPTLGLVASAGRPEKDWPTERFADIATLCERELGLAVILLGGPSQRERRRAAEIMAACEAKPVCALGPDLRRLIYITHACDLMIAPDTGPLHIARALDTPVIGLFAHTDPRRAGPYRAYGDLLIDRFNYDAAGVPAEPPPRRSGHGRMSLISIADVRRALELAIERYMRPVNSVRSEGECL